MSIEKPISTIRKAVQGAAEESASEEFFDKPEQMHYKEALNFFRFIKIFEPDRFENIIKIGAKGKEIKDEMGIEKYRLFNEVLKEITEKDEALMKEAIEKIKDRNLPSDESRNEILKLNKRFLTEKFNALKNDPRITTAFSGMEEVFDKAINFSVSSMMDLLTMDQTNSKVESNELDMENLLNKAIEFIRSMH